MAATSTEAGSDLPALAAETSTVKYYYSKRNDSTTDPRRRAFGRQMLPDSVFGLAPPCSGQFEIGAFYEIDHEKLPPKSPIQLKAIRVVKVTETSKLDVTVSFPSTLSLRNYFSFYPTDAHEPELDERFVMSLKQAVRILRRPVPSSTWEEEKHMESFWLVAPRAYDCQPLASLSTTAAQEAAEEEGRTSKPMGCCLLALKSAGILGWGIRRKVKYIGRHFRELPMAEKEEEEEEQAEEEEEVVVEEEQQVGQKRTREFCKKETEENKKRKKKKEDKRGRKKPRHEKEKKRKCEQQSRVKASKDRWSSERYEAAEMKLLDIMREKGAELGNPIMRQALREEARKHIGDTGLLDHLLKHMDGKTVAGGTERFRRRHNAEGAMEYWLEPAELVELRRKAGVMDPYWVPPPGWKPGDAVSPCPCGTECKREISKLREEIAALKRDMELPSSLRNLEKVAKEVRPEVDNGSGSWQERYQSLLESNSKMEEKMAALSSHLLELKEEIHLLKEEKDKKTEMEGEMVTKDNGWLDGAGNDNKEGEERGKQQQSKNTISTKSCTTNDNNISSIRITPPTTIANINSNDDNNNDGSGGEGGGKRTVRRSGFRICKPQGTFLWPNSAALISSSSSSRRNGGDVVVSSSPRAQGLMVPTTTTATTTTLDDQLMFLGGIPTPPSASSATSAPNLLLLPPPTSPVQPRVPDSAAAEVVVVPSSYQRHHQQQQERTPSSENICPSVHHHHLPTARGTSSPLGGGDGENKKADALWELADGGGWSNITTDLALATPSSYRR